jgi:hypothetical protein
MQYFQTAEDLGLYGVDPTVTNTRSKVLVATGEVPIAATRRSFAALGVLGCGPCCTGLIS